MGPAGDDGPGPTFSPALFYIGDVLERFERVFVEIGAVWRVPDNVSKEAFFPRII